jgi:cobalt-zinc-cadmium efflux system protein
MAGHDHTSQGHVHERTGNERRIAVAAILTGTFMLAEIAGGAVSGSLALIADAGHMLTDFGSLLIAWYGFRLARRPADWRRSYGYDRFSILAAFANGMALFALAAWIISEAVHRIAAPGEVLGGIMLWVALGGLVVNVVVFWILMGGDRANLNVKAATLHVAGDLLGSVAALVGALVILHTGWTPVDPLLSLLVAMIILRSAWHVVSASGHILLEGTPEGLDGREIARDLQHAVPGVLDVHHVHAWSISQERPMVTLHARIEGTVQPEQVARALKQRLRDRFGVAHATVEIEREVCADDHEHPPPQGATR